MMKFVLIIIGTIIFYSTPALGYNNFFHSGQASHSHSDWHHGTNFEHHNSRFPDHETQYPFNDYNIPFDVDDTVVPPPELALCQCLRQCYTPRDEYPVCGTNHFTYASIEQLICSRECGVDVNLLQRGRCPPKGYYNSKPKKPTVPKPVTPTEFVIPSTADNKYSTQINNCKRQCFTIASYDPVCGTDYVLYFNSELLRCFRNCGVDVDIMQHGKCPTKGYNYPKPTLFPMKPIGAPKPYPPTKYIPPSTPDDKYSPQINDCKRLCSTTSPYDPVCGTDYVLYYNSAILGCARECGIDVAFLQQGSCPAVPLSIGDTVLPATDDVFPPTTYDHVPTNGDDVPSTTDAVVPTITDDFVATTGGYMPLTGGDIPPTGGDIPSTGGDIQPTGGDNPPTGGDNPPTGGDNPPTGGDIPPTGGGVPPTGGDAPPTGGDAPPTSDDAPPTSDDAKPTSGDAPPNGGDAPPTSGDAPPTSGDAPPTSGDAPPTSDDAKPTSGDAPPNGGDAPPTSGDAPPTSGDAPPTSDDAKPTSGDAPPNGGDAPPTGGDASPTSGDAPPTSGDAPPTSGDAPPTSDDAKPTSGDAPPNGGDAPPTGGDASPTGGDASPTGGDASPTIGDAPPTGGDVPPTGTDVSTNSSEDIPPDTSDKADSPPLVTDDGIKQCILNCRSGLEYYTYTPVCGTNNIQYDNQRHVLCSKGCGIDVNILHAGVCASTNEIVTGSTAPSPIPSGSDSPPNTSTKLPPELNFDVRIKEETETSTK